MVSWVVPSQTEEVGRGGCWFPIGRRQEGGDTIGILGMSGHKRSFKPTTPSIPHKLAMGRGWAILGMCMIIFLQAIVHIFMAIKGIS